MLHVLSTWLSQYKKYQIFIDLLLNINYLCTFLGFQGSVHSLWEWKQSSTRSQVTFQGGVYRWTWKALSGTRKNNIECWFKSAVYLVFLHCYLGKYYFPAKYHNVLLVSINIDLQLQSLLYNSFSFSIPVSTRNLLWSLNKGSYRMLCIQLQQQVLHFAACSFVVRFCRWLF